MKNTKRTDLENPDCGKCRAPFPVNPPGHCGGTGYAIKPDGMRICYACADAEQREELKDRSKPFVGYVSSDARSVTTWTGGKLMTITDARECRFTRWSYVHGKSCLSVHAVDVHGGHWTGRGSPGIAIRLRAVKGTK